MAISNAGLCFARDRLLAVSEEGCGPDSSDRECLAAEALKYFDDANPNRTYGALVKNPDMVNFPDQSFDRSPGTAQRINWAFIDRRNGDLFAGMGELIRNPHHFGAAGLHQFHTWHEFALAEATRPNDSRDPSRNPEDPSDSLRIGLAYNAYADHFLEDFFAPGHVTEIEAGKSNMELVRVHDRDNKYGRDFEIRNWPGLSDILGSGATARERVSRCWHRSLRQDSAAELIAAASSDATLVRFFGDSQLERSDPQSLFMSLVVARSILDVVESFVDRAPHNSFPNVQCRKPIERGDCYFVSEKDGEPYAGIKFGAHRHEELGYLRSLFYPVLGFSADIQQINSGSRQQFSGEVIINVPPAVADPLVPDLGLGDVFGRQNAVLDVGAGYSYVRANHYQGHGPDLHVYLRLKRIYTFIAADVGYRFYKGRGFDTNGVRAAGRLGLEIGPLALYFSISRDRSIEAEGPKTDGSVWGFGATLQGSPYTLFSRF